MSSIVPVASTWPCTKWPPSRASARIGRSRFTSAPRRSAPSAVTRAVSGEMSAWTRSTQLATAVRHTPLTARLSPGGDLGRDRRGQTQAEAGGVGFISATSPMASIRPVNIGFGQHIGPQRFRDQGPSPGNGNGSHSGPSAPHGAVSYISGRDRRGRRPRTLDAGQPPFDNHRGHAARHQPFNRIREENPCRARDFRPCRLSASARSGA